MASCTGEASLFSAEGAVTAFLRMPVIDGLVEDDFEEVVAKSGCIEFGEIGSALCQCQVFLRSKVASSVPSNCADVFFSRLLIFPC